jgi:hypothetical protein
MRTPLQIQLQLDAINNAIASGATRVSYDGKSVEYRDLAEMRSVRDGLMRELGLPTRPRRRVAAFSSGF